MPLQKLTALQIQGCYTAMRIEPRADGRDSVLSARSIRYTHTVLKQALKQAVRWRLVPYNVAADVDPPKAVRPQIQTWDAAEAQRFLAIADTDCYHPLWRVALSTGMRKGELLGLRWCDLDLAHNRLYVRQQVAAVGGRILVGEPKTKAGRRTISLPLECVAALREHALARPQLPTPLDPAQRDIDLVFSGITGKALDQSVVYLHFNRLVAAAGVRRIIFHGMRHTHATLLLLAGVNIKAVAERLGHSSIQITLDTYAHVLPEMEQHAADAISRALQAGRDLMRISPVRYS